MKRATELRRESRVETSEWSFPALVFTTGKIEKSRSRRKREKIRCKFSTDLVPKLPTTIYSSFIFCRAKALKYCPDSTRRHRTKRVLLNICFN